MNAQPIIATIVLVATLALSSVAAESQYFGSRLSELDAVIEKAPNRTLIVYFDDFEGVRANLNVQVHQFAGTLKDYDAVSQKQMDAIFNRKWNTLSKKQVGENELFYELIGSTEGVELHFYARVVMSGKKVYLITSMAKQGHWETIGAKLRKHVDAFKSK